MKILKFGGTSVGSPKGINKVIEIVTTSKENIYGIVVSAFGGFTNQLIDMGQKASINDESYREIYQQAVERHCHSIRVLIGGEENQKRIKKGVDIIFEDLQKLLNGIYLIREASLRTMDLLMSFGERLSAYIIAQVFNNRGVNATFVDARKLVKTDSNFSHPKVDLQKTNENILNFFNSSDKNLKVITGFIASDCLEATTTLGRGGSDYTASIFGAALDVESIEIWTDVDGVKTCDPRKIQNAFSLTTMTYMEAMEMSHFGAKVIHPPTMIPAMKKKIPLFIKNTFNPEFEGTKISDKHISKYIIKGISSIDKIALIRLQGAGMFGVAGSAMRMFKALSAKKVNVIMITQASSEFSICIAIKPEDALCACEAINTEFKYEIMDKEIDKAVAEEDLSVVAVVGENMRYKPGIAGRIFSALGALKVNVKAIAQGSSELNISIIVDHKDEKIALMAIHSEFFE